MSFGTLYIVATPLGNLEDMSPRAREVLSRVDLVAAEDTRHTGALLRHFGVATPLIALHEHNEREQTERLIALLCQGRSLALASDAGTPLVSDPGFPLVRAARAAGITVSPIPGPSAVIAALSVAGLPSDRFAFEGFAPAKAAARAAFFEALARETRTLVFYESPHRLSDSLVAMREAFGPERAAVLARELTKKFEQVHAAPLGALVEWVAADENRRRGEFVILVHGAEAVAEAAADIDRVLQALLRRLPLKDAVAAAAEITGLKKNALYTRALSLHAPAVKRPRE